jgi:transcriptional regulator GlxA family with amidase domain
VQAVSPLSLADVTCTSALIEPQKNTSNHINALIPPLTLMDSRVARIRELLSSGDLRRPKFSEIAKTVNLSPSRMRHLFKLEIGCSLRSYMKQLRLKRADALLRTTFLSVKEIAAATGANNESHFVRAFKKEYGNPPARYRKLVYANRDKPHISDPKDE